MNPPAHSNRTALAISLLLLGAWFANMMLDRLGWTAIQVDDAATLRNLALTAAGYFLGSSAGSARKDDRLAQSIPRDVLPDPGVVVPAGNTNTGAKP